MDQGISHGLEVTALLMVIGWLIVKGSGTNGTKIPMIKSRKFTGQAPDVGDLGLPHLAELKFNTLPGHLNSVLFCCTSLVMVLFQKQHDTLQDQIFWCLYSSLTKYVVTFLFICMAFS